MCMLTGVEGLDLENHIPIADRFTEVVRRPLVYAH